MITSNCRVFFQVWSSFTFRGLTEGALKVGVFKFSLLATLPVVILVSLATNQKVQEEKMISTFETLVKRHQEAVVAKANQREHETIFSYQPFLINPRINLATSSSQRALSFCSF